MSELRLFKLSPKEDKKNDPIWNNVKYKGVAVICAQNEYLAHLFSVAPLNGAQDTGQPPQRFSLGKLHPH